MVEDNADQLERVICKQWLNHSSKWEFRRAKKFNSTR